MKHTDLWEARQWKPDTTGSHWNDVYTAQEASHNWKPGWKLKHAHLWDKGSQSELEALMEVKRMHTREWEAES